MKTLSKDKVKTIREDLKSLNEKERRQYLFKIAMDLGPGGMSHVSRRFNISITTLKKAKIEIDKGDYYIQGDKIRSTKEKSFLSEQTINESLEKIKFMKEKERRQYLYQIYLTISNKFGALGYICKTFHVSKETLYRAKAEFENGDIWQVGQRVRKIGAGRPKKKEESLEINHDNIKERDNNAVDTKQCSKNSLCTDNDDKNLNINNCHSYNYYKDNNGENLDTNKNISAYSKDDIKNKGNIQINNINNNKCSTLQTNNIISNHKNNESINIDTRSDIQKHDNNASKELEIKYKNINYNNSDSQDIDNTKVISDSVDNNKKMNL